MTMSVLFGRSGMIPSCNRSGRLAIFLCLNHIELENISWAGSIASRRFNSRLKFIRYKGRKPPKTRKKKTPNKNLRNRFSRDLFA